jgi:hypothetical protein
MNRNDLPSINDLPNLMTRGQLAKRLLNATVYDTAIPSELHKEVLNKNPDAPLNMVYAYWTANNQSFHGIIPLTKESYDQLTQTFTNYTRHIENCPVTPFIMTREEKLIKVIRFAHELGLSSADLKGI